MSVGLKGLTLGAGIVMTLVIISLAFYTTNVSATTITNGTSKINNMSIQLQESDKTMYEGIDVQGSEVINIINKFKSEKIAVKVVTRKTTTYYNRNLTSTDTELGGESLASIRDAQKIDNVNYINQNAMFSGEVLRDVNNAIIGLKFTQVQ